MWLDWLQILKFNEGGAWLEGIYELQCFTSWFKTKPDKPDLEYVLPTGMHFQLFHSEISALMKCLGENLSLSRYSCFKWL